MEQIYLIKYLRNHKGKSLRKIAEETGHDFQTVKKYVEKDDFNLYPRPKQQRKGKLDPQRFMLHYGFCTNFCNPNSGHEKGHIENKVGYNRRNFLVPIPEFEDIKEFNRELLKKCDQDMERNHYNKSGTIAELFREDKKAMNALPKVPFEVYRLELAKADNYGKVKFDNHIYSSAPNIAQTQLWVKAGAHEVVLMNQIFEYFCHPSTSFICLSLYD